MSIALINILRKLESKCDLFIFDINGVLDNQFFVKVGLIRKYGGIKNQALIKKILVDIERIFEDNKKLSLDKIIFRVFRLNHLKLSKRQATHFKNEFIKQNQFSIQMMRYINSLSRYKKVVFYTSLSRCQLKNFLNLKKIKIFSKNEFVEPKPSITNLVKISNLFKISPLKTVLIGDNVVCDLMPAKLFGMKTVLVTPYVDFLVSD